MKCENCGKNIANFHYKSTVNGKVTEAHLCSECAEKLGYGEKMAGSDIFDGFFDSFFSSPFGRMDSLFGFAPMMMPVMTLPRLEIRFDNGQTSGETAEKTENKTETKVDPELSKRRELNMLKNQLDEAVKEQRYEDAIVLRDKIKELEN